MFGRLSRRNARLYFLPCNIVMFMLKKVLHIDGASTTVSPSWVTGERTNYRYGVWGLSVVDDSSSNYRELRNLVESLEMSGASGELNGKEVFLFTDNSTVEAVTAKESSTSPLLYELVVRLFQLSSVFLCSVNIIHVAGTRMIQQGTDGLSRGDMLEGV